jgi:small-conductance mechanosensitive channel
MNAHTTASVATPKARFPWLIAIVLLASASVVVFGPEHANAAGDSTEQSALPTADRPSPIPVSQLSTRSEEAAGLLRQLRDRPVPNEQIDKIEEALPTALDGLQDLMAITDAALTQAVSSRTLENLDRWWRRAQDRIDDWRSHVAKRARSIDRDTESLLELRILWEVTLEHALANDEQDVVLASIRGTLDQIRREESRFGEHRARMLNMAMRITQAEDMIASAFDQINTAKKELRVRLYVFDTPPLWAVLADPPPTADHVSEIRAVSSQAVNSLRTFFVDYRYWLIVHAIALILLVVLMRSLHKRAMHLKLDDPDLADAINVVSRPFSSALLLSLTGLVFFYHNPPRIVDELTTILCFIPLYRLLPRKVFRRIGRLLIWLISLHVIDRVVDILPYLSLLKRLLLLLLTTLTFAIVLRAIREDATKHISGTRALRTIEKTAAFLLAVAFIANVLGNLSLADMIVSAVISSAYSALVLYALYIVVDAVLRLGIGTRFARKLRMVRRNGELIHQKTMMVLRFGLKVLWLGLALYWLQILPLATELVGRVLNAQARFGDIGVSLGGVLAFAVTVWVAFLISRILRFILEEDVYPRMTLPRGVPNAVSTALHYILLLAAFILAVAATGADLNKFAILAGAFGVGIGFGLQNVVNNFISGLILIAERPIMPGDTIEFGNRIGDVKRIGLRSSTIRTWSGAEVIVPNGTLISNEVINWTLSDKQRRLDIPVGVAYGSPVTEVMEILVSVAAQHRDIMDNPSPRTLFIGFGDSSLNFELRCWTGHFEQFRRISSDLVVGIEAALNEAGIVIPFPQRDLHFKTVDANAARTMRGEPPVEAQQRPAPEDAELPRVPKRSQTDAPGAPPDADGGQGGD